MGLAKILLRTQYVMQLMQQMYAAVCDKCRRPPKPEPGRVTRAFLEFGSKDDWVSKTLLKHTLAAIIQASTHCITLLGRAYW